MTLVSSKEFVSNGNKYFDLALNEQVAIKRGKNIFHLIYSSSEKPSSKARQNWAECAKEFAKSGDEETFFPDFFADEDLNWWQWKQK